MFVLANQPTVHSRGVAFGGSASNGDTLSIILLPPLYLFMFFSRGITVGKIVAKCLKLCFSRECWQFGTLP